MANAASLARAGLAGFLRKRTVRNPNLLSIDRRMRRRSLRTRLVTSQQNQRFRLIWTYGLGTVLTLAFFAMFRSEYTANQAVQRETIQTQWAAFDQIAKAAEKQAACTDRMSVTLARMQEAITNLQAEQARWASEAQSHDHEQTRLLQALLETNHPRAP